MKLTECKCMQCGSSFFRKSSIASKKNRGLFCSRSCRGINRRVVNLITCKTCETTFNVKTSQLNTAKKKGTEVAYCSILCANRNPIHLLKRGASLRQSEAAKNAREKSLAIANSVDSTERSRRMKLAWSDPEKKNNLMEAIRKRSMSPIWLASRHFQRGVKHPRFNGGKTERRADRARYETKAWRRAVFERDHFTCQDCGIKPRYLNAHHIESWAKFPEKRYDIDNGVTLCVECHKLRHSQSSAIK